MYKVVRGGKTLLSRKKFRAVVVLGPCRWPHIDIWPLWHSFEVVAVAFVAIAVVAIAVVALIAVVSSVESC